MSFTKTEWLSLQTLLLVIFSILTSSASGQIVSGRVMDKTTREPIDYATIYINGSFVAVYTDKSGNFEIDIKGNTNIPLSVSALGYFSETISDIPAGKKLIIYLTPKIIQLNEVVVTADWKKRQRIKNLKLFKRQFLGETFNATRCEIINESDIKFRYSDDSDTLKAISSKPVLIRNKALGYSVTYYLDGFSFCISDNLLDMKGNILFKEDLSKSGIQKKQYERRRKKAYSGSRMNFIRSVWADDLKSDGFKVNPEFKVLGYKEITGTEDTLFKDDPVKFIKREGNNYRRIYIEHESNPLGSGMTIIKDFLLIKKNGYFDGGGVIWEGDMGRGRIGDWLPFEYIVRNRNK